jgi:hypothetical protein
MAMAKKSLLTSVELLNLESTDLLAGLRYGGNSGVLREQGSIRIIGCGQAGTRMAAVFRRRPDWIRSYSRHVYPVNAISVDSQQENIGRAIPIDSQFQWPNDGTQLLGPILSNGSVKDQIVTHFSLRVPSDLTGKRREDSELKGLLLENAAVREGLGGDLHLLDEELREFWTVGVGGGVQAGGAGGLALDGRAAALWSLDEREEWLKRQGEGQAQSYLTSIEKALSSNEGYILLTMASLDGGTGSGSSGVINGFVGKYTKGPHPILRMTVGVFTSEGADNSVTKRANRLISLYYLLKNPRNTDGVILVDNSHIREKNKLDAYDGLHDDENAYLHKVLMPVLLAQLPTYNSTISEQLDLLNIKNLLRTGGGNTTTGNAPEVIVACFSEQPEGGRLDIDNMIEKALCKPTARFTKQTGRSALCVLSGAFTQSVISENRSELNRFTDGTASRLLDERVRDASYGNWRSRFFLANFNDMPGFRLTILISGCKVPDFEKDLMKLANTTYNMDWNVTENRRLAESLRSLDEADVRLLG